MIYTTRPFI